MNPNEIVYSNESITDDPEFVPEIATPQESQYVNYRNSGDPALVLE
jgi:hypothetical protein